MSTTQELLQGESNLWVCPCHAAPVECSPAATPVHPLPYCACPKQPALPCLYPAYSHTPGSCTLVGLSAMFIRVAFTIWLFTVYCSRGSTARKRAGQRGPGGEAGSGR